MWTATLLDFSFTAEKGERGNALSGCPVRLLKLAVQLDCQDFKPEVSHIRVAELQCWDFSVSHSVASVEAKVGFDGCKAARLPVKTTE